MNTIRNLLTFLGGLWGVRTVVVSLVVAVSLLLTGCTQQAEDAQQDAPFSRYQYTQLHLGVQVKIVLYAEKEVHAIQSATEAFSKIATLEDIFSNYRQESEINRLTKAPPYEPVSISEDLYTVLKFSQALSRETNGAFDITLGPYIALWKEARSSMTLPSAAAIESASHKVGWQLLEIDSNPSSVTINQKGMQLDLGGIAKGYILDEAMTILKSEGIQSALIEAGGDIVVSGPPPGKTGWTIEVQDVVPNSKISSMAGSMVNSAISTSGDNEQFVEIDGKRYSHVIDPSTGLGSIRRNTVTVIAASGIASDSYATALGVMTEDERKIFLERHPHVTAHVRKNK